MAKATFKRGEIRTGKYTAAADIAVDDVVIGGIVNGKKCAVAVARQNIATGAEGIVALSGVFEFPKATAAVIKMGEGVNWDASTGEVDDNAATAAAGDVVEFGKAVSDAGAGVLVLDVDISEPGTYNA